jgi:hypothetical protein
VTRVRWCVRSASVGRPHVVAGRISRPIGNKSGSLSARSSKRGRIRRAPRSRRAGHKRMQQCFHPAPCWPRGHRSGWMCNKCDTALFEHFDIVIGGDPHRDTIDLAILDADAGRVLVQAADWSDGSAYTGSFTCAVRRRRPVPQRRVSQHPAEHVLLPEPGVGPSSPQLLVSWCHRGRVRSGAAFAALTGVAPLEASSAACSPDTISAGWANAASTTLYTPRQSPASVAMNSRKLSQTVQVRQDSPRYPPQSQAHSRSTVLPHYASRNAASYGRHVDHPRGLTNIGESTACCAGIFRNRTDLSIHSAQDLDWAAAELNDRPGKRFRVQETDRTNRNRSLAYRQNPPVGLRDSTVSDYVLRYPAPLDGVGGSCQNRLVPDFTAAAWPALGLGPR